MTDRSSSALPLAHVHYPESDGEPMGETDKHIDETIAFRLTLAARYESAPDVYVAGNSLIYYEEGNPAKRFSPDVYVVVGIAKRQRRIYKLWEEGVPPTFVLEVSSRGTSMEDEGNKKVLCRRLGVREYFLFDPEGDYLDPRLQGYELTGSEYRRIPPGADGGVESRVLGIRMRVDGEQLRAVDVRTGEPLRRPEEERRARSLSDQRAESERQRADDERRRADDERRRADTAEERAARAEAELAALRGRLGGRSDD